ncbi:MAG TPA: electron transfer flavoprotein subunit beta/FixA family protein [Candidatus Brocadiales bacterium]|nr:electron transfer flavoprotein subunit beta/FixA family protein [Candidatus Brocadiales bacterium]
MNIIVCIKQVPSTEAQIKIDSSGTDIDTSNLTYVVNPYDEFGVEEALRIKEKLPPKADGKVTIISMGPDRITEAIRSCLAMGADDAIHIKGDFSPNDVIARGEAPKQSQFEGIDSYTTALILSEAIKKVSYDIILCGKQAVDDDNGAVGIELAELLNIPHVAVINKLEIDANAKKAAAHRQIEGGIEVVECALPAVFTCQKGLNEPRYATLPGIMKAKQKPCETINLETLVGAGLKPAPTLRLVKLELPPQRKAGKIIDGTQEEAVKELVRTLREAGII